MTIVEFLQARLDEDEQAARAAVSRSAGEWRFAPDQLDIWPDYVSAVDDSTEYPLVTGAQSYVGDRLDERLGAHIARHDPARVLAEVAVKRRIVALAEEWQAAAVPGADFARQAAAVLDQTLRLLAPPYADHPDYDPAWRPI